MVLQCEERSVSQHSMPNLLQFIKEISTKADVSPITLLVGLIYVHRLKKNLPALARGEFDTPYRIFLAAILVASKYLSDNSLHNKTIAMVTEGLFSLKDVNTMERSFLGLLKYELWVTDQEINEFLEEHRMELELEDDANNSAASTASN